MGLRKEAQAAGEAHNDLVRYQQETERDDNWLSRRIKHFDQLRGLFGSRVSIQMLAKANQVHNEPLFSIDEDDRLTVAPNETGQGWKLVWLSKGDMRGHARFSDLKTFGLAVAKQEAEKGSKPAVKESNDFWYLEVGDLADFVANGYEQ